MHASVRPRSVIPPYLARSPDLLCSVFRELVLDINIHAVHQPSPCDLYRLADHGEVPELQEDELEEANSLGNTLDTSLWLDLDELDNTDDDQAVEPMTNLWALVYKLEVGLTTCLYVVMVLDLAFATYTVASERRRPVGQFCCYLVTQSALAGLMIRVLGRILPS